MKIENKDALTANQQWFLKVEITKEIMRNFKLREDQASNVAAIILNNYINKYGLN